MQSENKIGKKFGKLTVTSVSPVRKYGKKTWQCVCDCGSKKIELRTSNNLTRGRKLHCGCFYGNIKDLNGQVFGFLTVIDGPFRNTSGRIVWKTRCACGTGKNTSSKIMLNGDAISCGCRGKYKKIKDWTKVPPKISKFIAYNSPERVKNIYYGPYICNRCEQISLFQSSNSSCVSCSSIKAKNKKSKKLESIQSKEHLHKIITIEMAREKGIKKYFNAIPCPAGHIADRWVINQACVECARQKKSSPDQRKRYAKKYNSKPENKKKRNASLKYKWKNDPAYLVQQLCRNRISKIFRTKNIPKSGISKELIGVDNWEIVAAWIESQFYSHPVAGEAMTWENRSNRWEIDHIIPLVSLSKVSSLEQQKKVCNYKNLQPLWEIDHLKKTLSQRKKFDP